MGKKKKKKVVSKKGVAKPFNHEYNKKPVRMFKIGDGLPSVQEIMDELEEYRDVLMGRDMPPIDMGVMTLMETAEGYFSRACELEQLIYDAIRDGRLVGPNKSAYSKLRTETIRSFKEMTKSATELGSRRVTWENLRVQQERRG